MVMPETLRLNRMVSCNGCGLMVNPYVVERRYVSDGEGTVAVRLECPTCKYEWRVEEE